MNIKMSLLGKLAALLLAAVASVLAVQALVQRFHRMRKERRK